jgi:transcriptional regulator with XRE-family HTH domain
MTKPTKGHWPKGKRRNADSGRWSRVRLSLQALLENHYSRGMVSARKLAEDLGVSDRSVRRWLSGEDRPDADTQEAVEQWVASRRPRKK